MLSIWDYCFIKRENSLSPFVLAVLRSPGFLPAEIVNFTSIEFLNLAANNITGVYMSLCDVGVVASRLLPCSAKHFSILTREFNILELAGSIDLRSHLR